MFANRKDAAIQLAHALEEYKDRNVVVLGIPRGGAETAYYVALHLNADLSLAVTRKLGHPQNPEAAFGAIAEDGSTYLSADDSAYVSEKEKSEIINAERNEINRRVRILRRGRPLPALKGKIVIIVDDGIATGATIFATIAMCKKMQPLKLIVAAPISSAETKSQLVQLVDDVVILETPEFFYAVGQGYRNFDNLTDRQTIGFLDEWEGRFEKSPSDV